MITVMLRKSPNRPGQRSDNPQFYVAGVITNRLSNRSYAWQPPTDVYELEDRLIVLVEIAGMDESEFTISIDRRLLTISGTRSEPVSGRKAFHQMEIRFGEFSTEVELNTPIDLDKVEAEYRNGFLWVTLPKSEPKQIHVSEG